MADQDQEIRLKFSAQTEAVEAARKHAAALKEQLESLQSAVSRGAPGWELAQKQIAGVTAELAKAERAAKSAQGSLDKAVSRAPGRMDAGKQSMLGFGVANALQDAYYNPAFAINNAMFLAQQSGGVKELGQDLKALAGVGVATAGGWLKAVPGLFTQLATAAAGGSVAVIGAGVAIAGAAVGGVALHKGLKDAGLGWSDLGAVLSNTTIVQGAGAVVEELGSAVTSTWEALGNTAAGEAVDGVWDGLKNIVHETANATMGWDAATEAAKRHKEITEEGAKAAADWAKKVAEANAGLKGIKSEDQKKAAEEGSALVQDLADLGGKDGLEGTRKRMASLGLFDENGAAVDDDRLKVEMNAAKNGDEAAMGRLRNWGRMAGIDVEGPARRREADMLNAEGARIEAESLRDYDKMKQDEASEKEKVKKEQEAQQEKVRQDQTREKEKALQEAPGQARKQIGGLDDKVQRALGLAQLGGANAEQAGKSIAAVLSSELQAKGMGKDEADAASKSIVEGEQQKLRDKVAEMAMGNDPASKALRGGPKTMAAVDFARNVQDGQDTQKDILNTNKAMLEKLAAIERNGMSGRLGR